MRLLLSITFLLALAFTSYGQEKESFYGAKWLEVYRLELKNLPKSALAVVDSIYIHAKNNNDADQRVKALIYQSKFSLILEEDSDLKVINQFKEEIRQSSGITKNILQNYLGEMYYNYLQRHRWQLLRRTKTDVKVDSIDFRTWDLQTLLAETNTLFKQSLGNFNELKSHDLNSVSALINRFDSVDI